MRALFLTLPLTFACVGCGNVTSDADAAVDASTDAPGLDGADAIAEASAASCAEAGGNCQSMPQCQGGGAPLGGYGCPSGEGCCIQGSQAFCNGRPCSPGTVCNHDVVDAGGVYQCAAGDGAAPTCGIISCGVGCTCAAMSVCTCQ